MLLLALVYFSHGFQTQAAPLASYTLFACSWLLVHPNIPDPDETWWRVFLRRLELMFWAVVGPELLMAFAFRQWSVLEKHKILGNGWTRTHGYFIQVGGFMLFYGEDAKGVLSPEQIFELLGAKKIIFPTITEEEIEDRSKADGFSKTIALGQTLWFVVQCLARRTQHHFKAKMPFRLLPVHWAVMMMMIAWRLFIRPR